MGGGDPHRQHCEGGVGHAPPKFGEGGGLRSPGRCDPCRPCFGGRRSSRPRRPRKIPSPAAAPPCLCYCRGPRRTASRRRRQRGRRTWRVVVGEGLSSTPILTTTTPGVSLTTWGAQTRMTTTTTTPPPPPPEYDGDTPRGEGGRDDDGAGRRRDGGGGEQGRGRNERDKHDKRDRSSGSARSACGGGNMAVVPRADKIVWCIVYALTHKYLQMIPVDYYICADIWSRQQISGHAVKTSHIGINMNH